MTAAILASLGWQRGLRIGVDVDFINGVAIVKDVDPAGPAWAIGVRNGDRVLIVDGRSPAVETWHRNEDVANSITFVLTDSRIVTVRAEEDNTPGIGAFIGLQLTAAIYAAVGLFVFARPLRSLAVSNLSIFAIIGAIVIAAAPGAAVGDPASRTLEIVSAQWVGVSFVFLSYLLGGFNRRPAPPTTRLPVFFLILIALALTSMALLRANAAPVLHSFISPATYMFVALNLLVGCGVLSKRYLRSESPVIREQTRVIALGTVLGVFPVVFLSAIPQSIGAGFFVDPGITVIGTVLIPVAFAYSILRHEFMGIRRLVHRGVAYGLISAFLLTVYVVIVMLLQFTEDEETISGGAVGVTLLVVLLVGVALVPRVREFAFSAVDRLLYRDFSGHSDVVRRISQTALEMRNLRSLMSSSLDQISNALQLSYAAYASNNQGKIQIVSCVGDVDEHTIADLAFEGSPEPLANQVMVLNTATAEPGQYAVASIASGEENAGLLVLGPKGTGEAFLEDDVHMLHTIAGVLSTAASRLRLLEELQEKNIELTSLNAQIMDVEEQERARLSAYLHDEPLQKVTYVLARSRENGMDDHLSTLLSDAATEMRTISASLSPAVLADLGLVRTVEWLASELEDRAGFTVDFRTSGIEREQRLPSALELVAYRVIQEALTNCQKHSNATVVWVRVKISDGEMVISVEDNGQGILAPDSGTHKQPKSLGLLAMRQRVESQNGTLTTGNRYSGGFSVRANIPI